jgi:hypothetical protein
MTTNDQLKYIARSHKWAYRELVYGQKMIEWNKLCNGGLNTQYKYLKSTYAAGVVLKLQQLIFQCGKTPADDIKKIAKEHEFAFGELSYRSKLSEAHDICSKGLNEMFMYLQEVYGSKQAVLTELSYLILNQRKPVRCLFK